MVYLFLAEGFEEVEALTPVDFMRRADIEVTTVGVGGEYITGAHGITVKADVCDSDVSANDADIEMVVLPGGMPGTLNLQKSSFVQKAIDYALENDKYLCAICAAPLILGHKEILKDKKATCYPGFEDTFKGGKYLKQSVVKCENFITSDGMGSAYKFGFEIAAALFGDDTAEKIKEQIQY